ncbi:MAG: hypothetical protein R2708_25790 [Vicinamibacterales bacterium]
MFRATLTRTGDGLFVFIDCFADVSVFNAVSLDTSLRLRGAGVLLETDAGSHTFSSSQAVPAGNHTTSHTLVCSRRSRFRAEGRARPSAGRRRSYFGRSRNLRKSLPVSRINIVPGSMTFS